MLVPDPKVLRTLLTRYAETRFAHDQNPSAETQRALDDVTYTLCVTTSTARIEAALAAADALLAQTCCTHAAAAVNAAEEVQERSQTDLAA